MQLIQKLRDDQKCMKKFEPSCKSKAIEDIISIGSFIEALVLNHYALVRKIIPSLFFLQDLTDGGVIVFERQESDGKWGTSPHAENDDVPSSITAGATSTTDQAQREHKVIEKRFVQQGIKAL
nr:hypothetical protein [Tanacetum cinerariifolium]